MTYCVSDIHGCYFEFMELLEKISFGASDTLYILGDIVDRGEENLECLEYAYHAENIICLMGNHEQVMLDFFPASGRRKNSFWLDIGGDKLLRQLEDAGHYDGKYSNHWNTILKWVREFPYYAEVSVNGKKYFLSHAGLNTRKPFDAQDKNFFTWGKDDKFHLYKGLRDYYCVFGHTPTYLFHHNGFGGVWLDPTYGDKTCIDCGCIFGGVLCALRLDDGEVFYVPARAGQERLASRYISPI